MADDCGLIAPCPENKVGAVFLMAVYGYIVLQGANLMAEGSELLLEILDPGLIGGLLLPILGATPDTLIIIFSGLGASSFEEAKEQIRVGVGTLAGSTVMLLTIAWGGSLILGRCDLTPNGRQVSKTLTHPRSLTKTGVSTDDATPTNAIIMVATAFLYCSVQVPAFMGDTEDRMAALIGGALCIVALFTYCAYQVVCPELQARKIAAARRRLYRAMAVSNITKAARGFGGLLTEDGNVRRETIELVFEKFDSDQDGRISAAELRSLVTGLGLATGLGSTGEDEVAADMEHILTELDSDRDGELDKEEFIEGMTRWIQERVANLKITRRGRTSIDHIMATTPRAQSNASQPDLEALVEQHSGMPTIEEGYDSGDEEDDESEEGPLTPAQIARKSALLLVIGTAICAYFSDPLVDAVGNVGKLFAIDPFFVAFIFTPLASNASELVSSLKFAAKKRVKNISLTYSQVYGAVTMNNTLCLGVFLLIVAYWGLPWDYTAEVLVTVGPTIIIGILGMSSTSFKTAWAVPVLLLFPLSIFAVWGMEALGLK